MPEVPRWRDQLEGTRDAYGRELEARGFTRKDDASWFGPIMVHSGGKERAKHHWIVLPTAFPFTAPSVRLPACPASLNWHLERTGTLCLYRRDDTPDLPWQTVDGLLDRVREWYIQAEAGWPDDPGDPDLQRYFGVSDAMLVTYGDLAALDGPLRPVERTQDWFHLDPAVQSSQRPRSLWAYAADLGVLATPVWSWGTVRRALGDAQRDQVDQLVASGRNGLLLLQYARDGREGIRDAAVVLRVEPPKLGRPVHKGRVTVRDRPPSDAEPKVSALSVVQDTPKTRVFRAGPDAGRLSRRTVAVVGCGAVGSFTADLLARCGVGSLVLVDPERLTPGNCVRHLADPTHVPKHKVDAVRDILSARQLMSRDAIDARRVLLDPEVAFELLTGCDVVVDAAADGGATGLLKHIAEAIGRTMFIKIALHRDGAIVRVDRYGQGTRSDAERPPFPPPADAARGVPYREAGCGDPISPTPPSAVVSAAAAACRMAVDTMRPTSRSALPDTVVEVLEPQPDDPYTSAGTVR